MVSIDFETKKLYVIYKLCCKDESVKDCYIGCTSNIKSRIIGHKNDFKNFPNRKVYKFISDNGGIQNWQFKILAENINSNNKMFLENACINEYNGTLNNNKVYLTEDEKSDYQKTYYIKNRKAILDKKKQIFDCECGSQYTSSHIMRHMRSKLHSKRLLEKQINELQLDPNDFADLNLLNNDGITNFNEQDLCQDCEIEL